MIEMAANAAWPTDKGVVIAAGVIAALRQAKILLPSISTIERAGIAGRARARKQATHAVLSSPGEARCAVRHRFLLTLITPLTWLSPLPRASRIISARF